MSEPLFKPGDFEYLDITDKVRPKRPVECAMTANTLHEERCPYSDTVCAFCGMRFKESGIKGISRHVLTCEKHPLLKTIHELDSANTKVRNENTLLRAKLAKCETNDTRCAGPLEHKKFEQMREALDRCRQIIEDPKYGEVSEWVELNVTSVIRTALEDK